MQSPSLAKDLCLAVIDGGAGFGNGCVLPAGPLREPLTRGLGRAHALILVGEDRRGALSGARQARSARCRGRPDPRRGGSVRSAERVRLWPSPGFGRPEKFFETLEAAGCTVIARHAFADHHRYKPGEIAAILSQAKERDAQPVTTEKDYVRLPPDAQAAVRSAPCDPRLARPGGACAICWRRFVAR